MRQLKSVTVVSMSAVLIVACSSNKTTASSGSSAGAGAASAARLSQTARASTSLSPTGSVERTTSPATSTAGLSGTWRGTYGGSFTGTFVLQWTQATSKLTGTITLSTEPGALPLNGTVSGANISFGTVGSQAITYTGAVSGASMHGQYQIAGGAGGSGPWSAVRG